VEAGKFVSRSLCELWCRVVGEKWRRYMQVRPKRLGPFSF
jgi:hypothetical protein